jgi:hypothetical protein
MSERQMMKRIYFGLIATALAIITFLGTNYAIAATQPKTIKGLCHNGASWTLKLERKGSIVAATYSVSGMKTQQWNANWAWIPINTVYNESVYAKNGKFTVKHRVNSVDPVTVYLIIDESWAYNTTCIAGGTI